MKPVSTRCVSSPVSTRTVWVAARVVVRLEHGHVVLLREQVRAHEPRYARSDDRELHSSTATASAALRTAEAPASASVPLRERLGSESPAASAAATSARSP